MKNFFKPKEGAASKQTGLFGAQPKTKPAEDAQIVEDADMDIDEAMLKKVNELPKYVPWVEK